MFAVKKPTGLTERGSHEDRALARSDLRWIKTIERGLCPSDLRSKKKRIDKKRRKPTQRRRSLWLEGTEAPPGEWLEDPICRWIKRIKGGPLWPDCWRSRRNKGPATTLMKESNHAPERTSEDWISAPRRLTCRKINQSQKDDSHCSSTDRRINRDD